jgi:RNA polymerase sigma-70 factor (ECF subfamily)
LADELWLTAEAEACGLTVEEFSGVLAAFGEKFNFGLPPGTLPGPDAKAGFLRGLRLSDLALTTACALGREVAWKRFVDLYRDKLTQAAIAITGSATLGHELADSLYGELYGLRTTGKAGEGAEVKRRSPLSSYSGRGSLLGWLRTTLAQRHVDHHRRTRRETPLDSLDAPAPDQAAAPIPAELANLTQAVGRTLQALGAEDRFLLSAYFLDRQTLLQIARTLHVHEATISRRIKRLTADLRKHLIQELQAGGLSERAAEEALGTDPRDLEINLRSLLQTSQGPPFPNQMDSDQVKKDQLDQSSSAEQTKPDAPGQS